MPFVSFFLRDDTHPRTEYWQHLSDAIRRSASFRPSAAELLIPEEDMTMETNWPRYGQHRSAYVRGAVHRGGPEGPFAQYFERISEAAEAAPERPTLYVNMHAGRLVSDELGKFHNVIVAEVCLTEGLRERNRRTISMPAMPVVSGKPGKIGPREVLASFQGQNSDPVRAEMQAAADGKSILVNFVDRKRYVGKVDATTGNGDASYEELLRRSTFALVPRGDTNFSYRLLEVMSFGCIPVILSDGWVLPFDRIVGWEDFSVRVRREDIPAIPQLLASFSADEIADRQKSVVTAYQAFFANFDRVVAGLLMEVDLLLDAEGAR